MREPTTIRTIGHSSRSWEEFVALLREFSIEIVCDVRAWPNSRRFPHFSGGFMRTALAAECIAYQWMGRDLGGHRKSDLGDASPNRALSDPAFRRYADHMQSDAFRRALDTLIGVGNRSPAAVMCAEADYSNCHRRLLSDALVARGVRVVHIRNPGEVHEHRLSESVRISEGVVTYPLPNDLLDLRETD